MAQVNVNNTVYAQVRGLNVAVQISVNALPQVSGSDEAGSSVDDAVDIAAELTSAAAAFLNENYGA